jgi:hypothetical protein
MANKHTPASVPLQRPLSRKVRDALAYLEYELRLPRARRRRQATTVLHIDPNVILEKTKRGAMWLAPLLLFSQLC